jgi:hypothetical protein
MRDERLRMRIRNLQSPISALRTPPHPMFPAAPYDWEGASLWMCDHRRLPDAGIPLIRRA